MTLKLFKFIGRMLPKGLVNIIGVLFYGKLQYNEDRLITIHTCNFRRMKNFLIAKHVSKRETGFEGDIDWRLHTVLWAAKQCTHLEGDFIECGVSQGFLMRAVAEYVKFNELNKRMYLLDTFEGMPMNYVGDAEKKANAHVRENFYLGDYRSVSRAFKDFKNVKLIAGKIPETLSQVPSKKIAFMSIDLNNAFPEIESMKFFWDRVVEGGIIILDDYAYSTNYQIQRQEWDALANKLGFSILTLATGQGMIIKEKCNVS